VGRGQREAIAERQTLSGEFISTGGWERNPPPFAPDVKVKYHSCGCTIFAGRSTPGVPPGVLAARSSVGNVRNTLHGLPRGGRGEAGGGYSRKSPAEHADDFRALSAPARDGLGKRLIRHVEIASSADGSADGRRDISVPPCLPACLPACPPPAVTVKNEITRHAALES